ncbi:lipid-transfer protein [Solimonas sp. K1W22B-7]|uniref:thiolase C-terminal domain-containing protein n=1 Tax=Solimonas sp. K1W22B-7 TaxID=2303331 RepID=UPI000E335355|nr:lipid-transfer protein [Solimonas sp. K1W22B-7]AXQ30591.1 lipid-transfer protein [Solimonas sp. K1W22B-7]
MSRKAYVGGVGMVKFSKPGASESYADMGAKAVLAALKDAGLELSDVQQAYASYIYGDSACGQRALFNAGVTDVPVFNVNNNCSSGSSALFLARQAVEAGADCVLAFGFEEMRPGALGAHWDDRVGPGDLHFKSLFENRPQTTMGAPALVMFGSAGFEYLEEYGARPDLFAKVAVKTRRHAVRNPYSLFTKELSVEEVMAAPVVYGEHLTKLMCCPPTCGGAAAVLVSREFAARKGISRLVEIAGQGMASDTPATYRTARDVVGFNLARSAREKACAAAGIGPEDVDVIELHDCFTPNEVITYEALGLCEPGGATRLVDSGNVTYGGKYVVNPSGGLMSKGHPIGATGLAQCNELVTQLRGEAGVRQVEGARVALQHNIGVPGGVVVTLYKPA